jgi:hypothetical protein
MSFKVLIVVKMAVFIIWIVTLCGLAGVPTFQRHIVLPYSGLKGTVLQPRIPT